MNVKKMILAFNTSRLLKVLVRLFLYKNSEIVCAITSPISVGFGWKLYQKLQNFIWNLNMYGAYRVSPVVFEIYARQ